MASKPTTAPPIEQAIGRALHLHRSGKSAQAESAYREILQRAPNHPHALHFYGMYLHERGKTGPAIEHLERSLAAAPGDAQVENNLAGLYLLVDRLVDAERTFLGILARAPESVPSRFNLGVLYARSKRWPEAVMQLEAARALVVDLDVLRELGDALIEVGRFVEAVAVHQDALALSLGDAEQRRHLSHAYFRLIDHYDRTMADPTKAIAQLRNWLAIDPDDAIARHTLAAYSGREVPERCSDDYVRRTFDLFAASFDEVLDKIRYAGVTRAAAAFEAALGPASPDGGAPTAVIVDAGCGTGALGPIVRSRCAKLIGVDLSSRMVERTRARLLSGNRVYDEVFEAELTAWLAGRRDAFDAIVCADTVIYFGDVAPLFRAAVGSLKPGGVFVFTVEALVDGVEGATFRLDRHGRYGHAPGYLASVLADAGAQVVATEEIAAIRVEYGADVPGTLLTARRLVDPVSA